MSEGPRVRVEVADALAFLRGLPAGSVRTCVTSPPYYGLRDYGTGEWSGGEASCTHTYLHGVQGRTGQRASRTFTAQAVYKAECGKCGARRIDRQIGLEPTPVEYVARLVEVFGEVRRALTKDGTAWVNMGDSYNQNQGAGFNGNARRPTEARNTKIKRLVGLKPGNLLGMPWRLAFALQADGWCLRSEIIWAKPNPMPESVTNRPTKAHEYLFLLSKSPKYFYNAAAIQERAVGNGGGGCFGKQGQDATGTGAQSRTYDRPTYEWRNRRSVWTVTPEPYPGAHFAVMPSELVRPCVLAGSQAGDTVLDPFAGSGTTLAVAYELGRNAVGCDLNPAYVKLAQERIAGVTPSLFAHATG